MDKLERLAGRLARGVSQLDAENAEEILETANLVSEVTEELASRGSRVCSDSRTVPAAAPGDVKTALVVDASQRDRARLRDMLAGRGYSVLEAETGEGALAVCEQCEGPIDVLLIDVLLDDMSGREVAERGSALQPDMRVIYMSGYADAEALHCGLLGPGALTLRKPASPEALARKLSAVAEAQYA